MEKALALAMMMFRKEEEAEPLIQREPEVSLLSGALYSTEYPLRNPSRIPRTHLADPTYFVKRASK